MAHRDPRVALRIAVVAVLSVAGALTAISAAQDTPASDGSTQAPANDTSSSKPHQSAESGTKNTVHHTRVMEEGSQSPDLAEAEDHIQKQEFDAAEPLLRKAVAADAANYVAWFDLGFTENALGKIDDSIAAYRKSVAAKPDVFESNLNLGLQLSKTNQPEAEEFLRAATKLKPTSRTAEGQYRAWVSLGNVLAKSRP